MQISKETKLLETIKAENGKFLFLAFHQNRVNWSREKLGFSTFLELKLPNPPKKGIFRCRIIYSEKIEKIEFIPYQKKEIKTFSLAFSDNIEYSLKYENRKKIDDLKSEFLRNADEIIIIKSNLVTDSSIANILFFDGIKWITPKLPLLRGTTRERLLQEKKIFTATIDFRDIEKFQEISFINAMIGFDKIIKPHQLF